MIVAYTREVTHPKAKERRDKMRALGICINSSLVIERKFDGTLRSPPCGQRVEHGPAVKAGKCQRCLNVHKGIE